MNKENDFEGSKFLEKVLNRYVIVSPDTCCYLVSHINDNYWFTDNITQATKFTDKLDADWMIRMFHSEVNDQVDLAIVPIEITYELINQTVECKGSDEELLIEGLLKMQSAMEEVYGGN